MSSNLNSRGFWRWLGLPLGDVLSFLIGLWTTLYLRQPGMLAPKTFLCFIPLFAVWIAALYASGLYELRLIRNFVALVRNVFLCATVSLFSGAAYFYILGSAELKPKTHLFLTVVIGYALIMVWRRAWLWLLKFNLLDQKIVFLGEEVHVREIEAALRLHSGDMGFSPIPWQWPGVDLVVADDRWVDQNWDSARRIFLEAVACGVPIVSYENFYEAVFGKVSPHYAGNPSWALEFVLPKSRRLYWKIKRGLDILGSLALLIAISPLLAAIAALIAILDGRPIFYGQSRAGFMGKPFLLWKFRTMTIGADSGGPFAGDRISRATRLGAVLRRLRLDELPQLWNVLRREMSLVGPRPEWMREVDVLEKAVPSYHLRHLVYPGITGWAQVYFRATNNLQDSLEKIHFDLFYVKYLSFGLDISILLKTLKRVLIHDSRIQILSAPEVKPAAGQGYWAEDLARLALAARATDAPELRGFGLRNRRRPVPLSQ